MAATVVAVLLTPPLDDGAASTVGPGAVTVTVEGCCTGGPGRNVGPKSAVGRVGGVVAISPVVGAAVIEVGEGDVAAPSSPRPIANMAMPTDTAASANPMTMYQPARRWESMQTSMNVADALWSPEHKYRRHRRVVAER
jgi:hypothetical protein